jgi:uncharacterized coiled-coil DUF342 family protein
MTAEMRRKKIPGIQANRAMIAELKQELSRISSSIEELNGKIREIQRMEREGSPKNDLMAQHDSILSKLRELKDKKAAELRNKNSLQTVYNEIKEELAPERGRGGKPMSVSDIDSKIKEIEFRIISDTLDVKTEDALASEIQELKRKRQSLGATEQRAKSAFETKSRLDESYLNIKQLTEEINRKQEEADEVRAEIKKINEKSRIKNPQIEMHERNIQALKARKEEVNKKITAQLDEIRKKEEEYNAFEKEILLARANEKRKDEIRERIQRLEGERGGLLAKKESCNPARFDAIISGLEHVSARSSFSLPADLFSQLFRAGIKCPTRPEEIGEAIQALKARQQESAEVAVDRAKEIDYEIAEVDKRILAEKKALEELPPTDARLLRPRRD